MWLKYDIFFYKYKKYAVKVWQITDCNIEAAFVTVQVKVISDDSLEIQANQYIAIHGKAKLRESHEFGKRGKPFEYIFGGKLIELDSEDH